MKRIIITSLILAIVMGMGTAFAAPEGTPDCERLYKLNIIGVDNPKNKLDQGAGNVIFVNLNDPSKINLVLNTEVGLAADEWAVLDKDATDSDPKDPASGAILALPDPGLDPYNVTTGKGKTDTESAYTIVIRSLGKPGGSAAITTCADLLDSNFAGLLSGKFVNVLNKAGAFGGYASVEQVPHSVTVRPQGKSIFQEVTAELLTIVFKVEVDISEEGEPAEIVIEYIRVPIFDSIIENEYWEYDNNGLKLLQVWFYDCPTYVDLHDGSWNNEPTPPAP